MLSENADSGYLLTDFRSPFLSLFDAEFPKPCFVSNNYPRPSATLKHIRATVATNLS